MNVSLAINKLDSKNTKALKQEQIQNEKDTHQLINAIINTQVELDYISRNINFVSDILLIDHFTFKLKAAESQYRYLVTKAKELGIAERMYVKKMYNDRYYK